MPDPPARLSLSNRDRHVHIKHRRIPRYAIYHRHHHDQDQNPPQEPAGLTESPPEGVLHRRDRAARGYGRRRRAPQRRRHQGHRGVPQRSESGAGLHP